MTLGIQPVLLSKWSKPSVRNLANVLRAYRGGKLEIGFAPFFNESDPFGKADLLIQELAKATFRPIFNVFLSFHRNDQYDDDTLRSRTVTFVNGFFTKYRGAYGINLSPMLEDEWNQQEFLHKLEVVARALPWELYPNLGLRFRRSNNTNPYSTGISFEYRKGTFVKQIKLDPPQREIHGNTGQAKLAPIYSNDGNFVFFENPRKLKLPFREDASSCDNADKSQDKYNLAQFKNAPAATLLLWRPAYNLYRYTVDRKATNLARYDLSPTVQSRTDSKENPAFDEVFETAVLKSFLGIS